MHITALCPYLHVASVDASLEFYSRLGFTSNDAYRDHFGKAFWASAYCGNARVMFARASGPIDAREQAVLLYLYSPDVTALRNHLLASGVPDAADAKPGELRMPGVQAITHPGHMPAGELRILDPDGYCLLVGQLT